MNIPMAYDVVPPSEAVSVSAHPPRAYAYGTHLHSSAADSSSHSALRVADTADMHQPMLLSDQESVWAQEMAQEGVAHLPVNWFRQTPKQALTRLHGVLSIIISALVNFGINVGIGYLVLSKNDEVGLWHKPPIGDNPYKSAAWSDLFITFFCIGFFTVLLSTGGIRDALKKGDTVPVDANLLRGGRYRFIPTQLLGTCSRSLVVGLWGCAVFGTFFVAILELSCLSGSMNGSGAECSMDKTVYIFLKATFATLAALVICPITILVTLSTATLPPLDLTFFTLNQREKWEKQQREKAQMQPL